MHRPYPALSLRSGQRSWRLTNQMHFVCKPAPAHRRFEYWACDLFLSRANSNREIRRGKALHLYTVRVRPRLQGGPTKHAGFAANDLCTPYCCHSERSEAATQRTKSARPSLKSRIIITGLEQNGPEIFRFAQDDSVVGIVRPHCS